MVKRECCMFKEHCHYKTNRSSTHSPTKTNSKYCLFDGTCNQKESNQERIKGILNFLETYSE